VKIGVLNVQRCKIYEEANELIEKFEEIYFTHILPFWAVTPVITP
jgi:hypothetical protein